MAPADRGYSPGSRGIPFGETGGSRGGRAVVIVLKGARRLLMAAAGVLVLSWLVQTGVVEPLVQTATAVVQSRRVPVYKVDTPEKKLAISFDATWGTEHTGRLLD